MLKRFTHIHFWGLAGAGIALAFWGVSTFVRDQARASVEQLPLETVRVQEEVEDIPVQGFNTGDDTSLQKYVGNGQRLHDSEYIPVDLAPIDSNFTANDARRFQLRQEAGTQFADLARYFWKEHNGDRLTITSAYRSSQFQDSLLKKGCSRAKCAQVGSSEHQLGLALDLGVITKNGKYVALAKGNRYYLWLEQRAPQWGFHNTYQKGIEVDGQMEEGRHWRYLGTGLASLLRDEGKTFSEWVMTLSYPLAPSLAKGGGIE